MNGFLLHLQGPMQSYGDEGYLTHRDAGRFPSRSAVLGIIAAAQGLRRDDERLVELHRALRVHVAVLRPGVLAADYHTIQPIYPRPGDEDYPDYSSPEQSLQPQSSTVQTHRVYHHDAHFLSLVEGEEAEVERARQALHRPVFTTYLGRRSCPPAWPLLPESLPPANSLEEVLVRASEDAYGASVPVISRSLERPDYVDLYLDGAVESLAVNPVSTPVQGVRRDALAALPRYYVNRPFTHLRLRLL